MFRTRYGHVHFICIGLVQSVATTCTSGRPSSGVSGENRLEDRKFTTLTDDANDWMVHSPLFRRTAMMIVSLCTRYSAIVSLSAIVTFK
ncbi:hypothetical protein BKA83DRAFT_2604015 [Pisolithus microcarpus]|nr:hypothetical protein BKA83DRAFT_2604015 [Pisolithus microcarpus]